jgi:hypothetical protein
MEKLIADVSLGFMAACARLGGKLGDEELLPRFYWSCMCMREARLVIVCCMHEKTKKSGQREREIRSD